MMVNMVSVVHRSPVGRASSASRRSLNLNPFTKNLALWLVITLMMVMLYNLFNQQQLTQNELSYSEFLWPWWIPIG
jgi:hypothetical protein